MSYVSEVKQVNHLFKQWRESAKVYTPCTYLAYRDVFPNNGTDLSHYFSKIAEIAGYFFYVKYMFDACLFSPALIVVVLATPFVLDIGRVIYLKYYGLPLTNQSQDKEEKYPIVRKVHLMFKDFRKFLRKHEADSERPQIRQHDFVLTYKCYKKLLPDNDLDFFDAVSRYAKITALFYTIQAAFAFLCFPCASLLAVGVLTSPIFIDLARIYGPNLVHSARGYGNALTISTRTTVSSLSRKLVFHPES